MVCLVNSRVFHTHLLLTCLRLCPMVPSDASWLTEKVSILSASQVKHLNSVLQRIHFIISCWSVGGSLICIIVGSCEVLSGLVKLVHFFLEDFTFYWIKLTSSNRLLRIMLSSLNRNSSLLIFRFSQLVFLAIYNLHSRRRDVFSAQSLTLENHFWPRSYLLHSTFDAFNSGN